MARINGIDVDKLREYRTSVGREAAERPVALSLRFDASGGTPAPGSRHRLRAHGQRPISEGDHP